MEPNNLHSGNAIWDDGEWVSWDEINRDIHHSDEGDLLAQMIQLAKDYLDFTGRPLPIYGEIGELFAERRYEFERHSPGAQGSDGRLMDDFVEVKTITPFKSNDVVTVKRDGHFNKLVIVRIDEDHRIDSRIIDRKNLPKVSGKLLKVSWDQLRPPKQDA